MPDVRVPSHRRRTGRIAMWAGGAAMALSVAACGSSASQAATPTTLRAPATSTAGGSASPPTSAPEASSTTVGPGTTPPAGGSGSTTTATTASVPGCATDGLALSAAPTDPGAGSLSYVIQFKNSGTTSCTLAGFPGVSFAGSGGAQATPGATRTTQGYAPVTLAVGRVASAVLRVAQALNFPGATCKPVTVTGLRIIPPGQRVADVVSVASQKACSGSVNQIQIGPMQAGVAAG